MFDQVPYRKSMVLMAAWISALAIGCSSTSNQARVIKKTETTRTQSIDRAPSEASAQSLNAENRNVVSSIEFQPGQRRLSPEATAELNRAILEAKQRGEVQEVNIAVWSDLSSADRRAAVPRSQVSLAKERGENIEKYVDLMEPDVNIKVHNMASKSTDFLSYLNSQDEATKRRLADVGVATNPEKEEVNGPSSSALVLIKVK